MVPLDAIQAKQDEVQQRIVDHLHRRREKDTAQTLRLESVKSGGWEKLAQILNAALSTSPTDSESKSTKMARYLVGRFTPRTILCLKESGELPAASKAALLAEINDVLTHSYLYKELPLLSTEAEKELEGDERFIANRSTLATALPDIFTPPAPLGKVTDIYVISHGWHRNFFGAAAAYDRIACRMALLMHRERFTPIRREPPFHPLFLMVHWHSDPGANGWVDRAGRRNKLAFLENCERLFERPTAHEERAVAPEDRFTSVIENIYELFTKLSAPDTQTLHDPKLRGDAEKLAEVLNRFQLRDAPGAEQPDKVAAAWAAYHSAPAQRFLANQGAKAGRFVNPWQAILDLVGFIGKAVGIAALGALLLPRIQNLPEVKEKLDTVTQWWALTTTRVGKLLNPTYEFFRPFTDFMQPVTRFLRPVTDFIHLYEWPTALIAAYVWMLVLAIPAWAWLVGPTLRPASERRKDGVNLSRLVAFLILLFPCAIPLILFLLVTYILGSICPRVGYFFSQVLGKANRNSKLVLKFHFDERIGKRNQDIEVNEAAKLIHEEERDGEIHRKVKTFKFPRYVLALLARWPVRLVRAGLAPDNPGHPIIDMIDQQFAFWEMQVMGADAGRRGALFVSGLYKRLKDEGLLDDPDDDGSNHGHRYVMDGDPGDEDPIKVRVHLLGHSFGGLLVGNLVRHLRFDKQCRGEDDKPKVPHVESVCLLQAAMASTWFDQEYGVRRYVKGGIGCIFSGYDSANGFYYPLANNSRLAAGFVGLYQGYPRSGSHDHDSPVLLPPRNELGRKGMFAALVSPPNLPGLVPEHVSKNGAATPRRDYKNLILNLDASRIVFDGPVAGGGGHSDIYKDDVMHLCWAVTRISRDREGLPPKQGATQNPIVTPNSVATSKPVVTTNVNAPEEPKIQVNQQGQ